MEKKKKIIIGSVVVACLFLIASSIYITQKICEVYEASARKDILARAGTIAASLNPDEVDSIDGNESDLVTENYKTLKRSLLAVQKLNPDFQSIYIQGLRSDYPFTYIDSKEPGDLGYSYPGEPKENFFPQEILSLKEGNAYSVGPYGGEKKSYSAGVPIKNSDNEFVGMLRVDMSAKGVAQKTMFTVLTVLFAAIIVIALLITSFVLGYRKGKLL